MKIANWGRFPVVDVPVASLSGDVEMDNRMIAAYSSAIPRGMGRCYGDSALGEAILSCAEMNRILAFDASTGLLWCESGVTIADLLRRFVSSGWFPMVTPGTKFVSIGGAIASDVHGKNHHRDGCFSECVIEIELLTPCGERVWCSRADEADLFWATVGGMGLTGVILSTRLRLVKVPGPFIAQRALRFDTLPELFEAFGRYAGSTYSVAWIDTILGRRNAGRNVLLLGEHDNRQATPLHRDASAARLRVPFDLPSRTLNRATISAFNWLFFHRHPAGESTKSLHYEPYFYPLDAVADWNRIYGRRGFTQYQLAVPFSHGERVIPAVLEACHRSGFSSFLSVLKAFGAQGQGLLSFPIEGLTLTLDLPIRDDLFPLLNRLDALVIEAGGRVYLTKDVRLDRVAFDRMYPRADSFREMRSRLDPFGRFQSLQSRRLGL